MAAATFIIIWVNLFLFFIVANTVFSDIEQNEVKKNIKIYPCYKI